MPLKQLYGLYLWLTPESARTWKLDLYGGARAENIDQALALFMRQHKLSYVERALIILISCDGQVLGGDFRRQVSCPVKSQEVTR